MNHISSLPEVLVVDDEPQVLAAIGDMLEDECVVHTAVSADKAISVVRENRGISVIISDQRMPQMDGATFLSQVQSLSSATRILLTGYADLEAVVRAVNEGRIFAYLSKPWDAENLKIVVHQAINYFEVNQALNAERRLLENLMESVPAAVYFKDRDHRFIHANAVAAEFFGAKTPRDLIGRSQTDILPADAAALRLEEEREIFRTGRPIIDHVFQNSLPLAEPRWYSSTKAPVLDETGKPYRLVCVTQDVTERVRREMETALLLEISRTILEAKDTGSAYAAILELIGQKTNWSFGQAWIWDASSENLWPGPVWHDDDDALRALHRQISGLTFEPGRGLIGRVFESKEAEWLPDVTVVSTDQFRLRDYAIEAGLHASLTVPVLSGTDTVDAVLQFFLRDAREPDRRQVDLIVGVARQLGVFTARKQAEEESRHSEERSTLLLEAAGEGIYGVDTKGRTTFCNSACLEILGYRSATPLLGQTMHHLIHHSHIDGAPYAFENCKICRAFTTGEHVYADDEVFWKSDGSSFPVEYRARPVLRDEAIVGAVVTFTDITQRVETERNLREQRSLLSNVLNSIPQYVYWKDLDARFIGCNMNFAQLFGFDRPEDIVGKNDFDLPVTREEAETYRVADLEIMERVETRLNLEETVHDADGTVKNLLTSKTPIFNAEGGVVGMLGVSADITEQKKMETQLHQAQKMEAVGQLTGGVAHDFNNLLTVVMGNMQLLERCVRGDHRQEKQVRMALDAAKRGSELTKRLLAFSRRQVLEPETANLNALVDGMAPLLRRTLGETIGFETKLADSLWSTRIDVAQFESALLNLAVNARDAMPDGGHFLIETRNAKLDERYAAGHPDLAPGTYAVVSVSDTGTGIPVEVMERVFEPFFTTKEVGQGSGLGLSMIYGFVKQSHGHVTIYSEAGQGTTIRLYFPRAEADEEVMAGAEAEAAAPGGPETILVVEDEQAVRETLALILEDYGYTVVAAADGPSALETLREGIRIDLLLTDVVMPGGLNGREVAAQARDLRPELKVLLTSGYPRETITRDGVLDEGIDFIGKPYEHDDLARKIREVLDG